MDNEAYEQGSKVVRELWGEEFLAERKAADSSSAAYLVRELGREAQFGRTFARPGLDMRTRLLCAIAAMTGMGVESHIGRYVTAAKRTGVKYEEVREVILQMTGHCGYPMALAAAKIADDIYGQGK